MAKINIEFDGKIYSVDEKTLTPLASPIIQTLAGQLAGTGVVIKLGGSSYEVDANKIANTRNVLTGHLNAVAGTDNKVTVGGAEYGLSKTKLQTATDKMHETLSGLGSTEEPELPASEGLEFRLNDDGASYSVAGIGTCTDTELVIPASYKGLPVINVDGYAFEDRNNLTSVTILEGVANIRDGAFMGCTNMTSITIPDSITSVGEYVFSNTGYYHNESNWENDVIYVGKCLITAKTSISGEYVIKPGTKTIADFAFLECYELENITFNNELLNIGGGAFNSCTKLTNLNLPNGIMRIGGGAFSWCSGLTQVTLPDNLTSLHSQTFDYCSALTTITLGKNLSSIGERVVYGCDSFVAFEVDDANATYKAIDGNLYSKDGTTFILYAPGKPATSFELPNNVKAIGDYAFFYCDNLINIVIPTGVTKIGKSAFSSCSNLASISIPDTVVEMGDDIFVGCSNLENVNLGSGISTIPDGMFASCSSLSNIPDSGNITAIGNNAFYSCHGLVNIEIPDGVVSIGEKAFEECDQLTSVTIPESVVSIDPYAFALCYNLNTLIIDQYEDESSLQPSTLIIETDYEYNEETGEETPVYRYLSNQATIIWKERA